MGLAIGAAGLKGEVICLNKGNYGSVIISQSVTISCGDGLWEANGGLVKVTTPAGSAVVIEGLVLEEGNFFGVSIQFTGQGVLDLRRVRGGNLSGPNANGVFVNCNGPSKVWISDSYFYNYAQSGILIQPAAGATVDVNIRDTVFSGNVAGGVFVSPASGASAFVALDHVSATGNSFGLGVGDGGTVSVRDSTFTGNANYGVVAFANSAPSSVEMTNSTIAKTASYGVLTGGGAGASVSLS